jgi:hypothetical protein
LEILHQYRLYATLLCYSALLCSTLLYSTLPVRILLITLHYPLVSALTPLLLALYYSTRQPTSSSAPPARPPAATLAAVSSLQSPRRTHGSHSSARCPLPPPLARDSYHVALALPSPSRVLAAHHTSKPDTPALVCLRSARADFRSATHCPLESLYAFDTFYTFDTFSTLLPPRPVCISAATSSHWRHSLLATISTTDYSPREHLSLSAASRLSQARRRVFLAHCLALSTLILLIFSLDHATPVAPASPIPPPHIMDSSNRRYVSLETTRGDRRARTRALPARVRFRRRIQSTNSS